MDDSTYKGILDRVANGELITDVCAELGIARSTLWRHSEGSEEARNAYARARVMQAHCLAEDTIRASKDARGLDGDGVAAQRLLVDSMKWLTTKIAPRIYGERIDIQAQVAHTVTGVIALPPEEEVPLPRTVVTARLGAGEDATVDADAATSTSEEGGGEGGPGEGAGRA